MSFPTRVEIKNAVRKHVPFEMDLDVSIQELVDRAYNAGVIPGSRKEVEVDLSTARTTWNEWEVIMFSPTTYDSMVSVRDNYKPASKQNWKVRDVEAEHQEAGSTDDVFVDHGEQEILSVTYRVYQLPTILKTSTEVIRCLMKLRPPTISGDTDEVPLKNLYLAKLGLIAIGYENESDARAAQAWQTFYAEAGLAQRRADGVKHRYIKMDHGLRHKPNNFM